MRPASLLFALGAWTAADARDIPVFHHTGPIKFEEYRRMTDHLTKPAIIKGYFNTSEFADICACDPKADLFDEIKLPYTSSGNPSHKLREAVHEQKAMQFNSINGGDFYRQHACDSSKDDYIFFDYSNGVLLSGSVQRFFDEKMNKKLRIEDITDEDYEAWLNEVFIGHSTVEYPLPGANRSGSAPHRAPVLNYYYQVCGRKRWHVADFSASFGDLDRFQFMLDEGDMHAFMANPEVFSGFTEPGDLLLNPPWVWHFVQTDVGFNYAVTYKQNGYGWWAAMNKMDVTQFTVNMKYGAGDLRAQRLPSLDRAYDPPKEVGGAFIVDLHDIRIPWWLIDRWFPKWVQAVLVIVAFLAAMAAAKCCCCCGRACSRMVGGDKLKRV